MTTRTIRCSVSFMPPAGKVPLSVMCTGLLQTPGWGSDAPSSFAVEIEPSGSTNVSSHVGSCAKPPFPPGGLLVLWSCWTALS